MAILITAAEMVSSMEKPLRKAFEAFEARTARTWSVYVDYNLEDMSWKIGKIEPWNGFKHDWSSRIMRVEGAQDELEAYTKAMERLEQLK